MFVEGPLRVTRLRGAKFQGQPVHREENGLGRSLFRFLCIIRRAQSTPGVPIKFQDLLTRLLPVSYSESQAQSNPSNGGPRQVTTSNPAAMFTG